VRGGTARVVAGLPEVVSADDPQAPEATPAKMLPTTR
jgi:hypothetical protein